MIVQKYPTIDSLRKHRNKWERLYHFFHKKEKIVKVNLS